MRVKVHSYDNPTNQCSGSNCNFTSANPEDFKCCDTRNTTNCTGGMRCDNMFTYCLQPLKMQPVINGCNDSDVMTSTPNWNGSAINFTQDMVLGLDNPFFLEGLAMEWMVS